MSENSEKQKRSPYSSKRKFKTLSAASLTRPFTDRAMRAKGFVQAEVIVKWPQIVGHDLSSCSLPVKLIFPRGERVGGTLVVRCESAYAPLLQHQTARITEMVNTFFGYGAVAKISLQQGPMPPQARRFKQSERALTSEETQKLETLVGDDEASPLQTALKKLGKQVLIKGGK